MKNTFSRYNPIIYSRALAFMLQSVEYQPKAFIDWYGRTNDFSGVMNRRKLVSTKASRMLKAFVFTAVIVVNLVGLFMFMSGTYGIIVGIILLLTAPYVAFVGLLVALILARQFISKPKEKKDLKEAGGILTKHDATIIAVAGSYGKTSMKELLLTVLSEGKKVAATPANMNVPSSHAKFARGLKGDEEVVIIEFGEGKPGDVGRYSAMAGADIAVITGLAPAHLDQYKTYENAAQDIMSAAEGKDPGNVYINIESSKLHTYLKEGFHAYNNAGCGEVAISDVKVGLEVTDFEMTIAGSTAVKMTTGLLGRHNLGPIAAVAEIAHSLGLSTEQIMAGVAKTTPFEHRMQPRKLASGAWVIDDTYNGNIEGMRAGLALLKEVPAKRKWYVTPGLVDQGPEKIAVHRELGRLIGAANPHAVVLMKNSVTNYILDGIKETMYSGEVRTETDPLKFYKNLDNFFAAGDVALLQNDWTDNYN